MRNQFYGDHKDVLKWSHLLRTAGATYRILYVVMLRQNAGNHGKDFTPVIDADPRVRDFFEHERFGFPANRDVRRVSRLLPGRIQIVSELYEHKTRVTYFGRIGELLKNRTAPWLVFLDPDNGIAGKRARGVHVCEQELKRIWELLDSREALVVYQHRFRDKEWISKRMEVFRSVVSPSPVTLDPRPPLDVCFFTAVKK